MTPSNLLYGSAFKAVAKKYNVVIGVRCPNQLVFSLLKEGTPSKNFHMKAKSSPSGPTAGYITEDPRYSKVDTSSYQQHHHYIDLAKKKGSVAVNLTTTKSRLDELIAINELRRLEGNRYSAKYPGGTCFFIIDSEHRVFDDKEKPVKVMTNPAETGENEINKNPITADYDLFTIIPRKQQDSTLRPMSIPPRLLRGNFDAAFLKPRSLQGRNEDINKGNIHFFGQVIINDLNLEIKLCGYTGGKLVWHNDETGNPFSPGFDVRDKPIFFLPSGEVVQVYSRAQLLDFYSKLTSKGYSPEFSPRFGF